MLTALALAVTALFAFVAGRLVERWQAQPARDWLERQASHWRDRYYRERELREHARYSEEPSRNGGE